MKNNWVVSQGQVASSLWHDKRNNFFLDFIVILLMPAKTEKFKSSTFYLTPGVKKKVIIIYLNKPAAKGTSLLKYVWPFIGHQTLKG